MRTTDKEIELHIQFIERHTNYKVKRDQWEKKPTYNVYLNDVLVAKIISDCKSDVWDMLNPFWEIGFENSIHEHESKQEV